MDLVSGRCSGLCRALLIFGVYNRIATLYEKKKMKKTFQARLFSVMISTQISFLLLHLPIKGGVKYVFFSHIYKICHCFSLQLSHVLALTTTLITHSLSHMESKNPRFILNPYGDMSRTANPNYIIQPEESEMVPNPNGSRLPTLQCHLVTLQQLSIITPLQQHYML